MAPKQCVRVYTFQFCISSDTTRREVVDVTPERLVYMSHSEGGLSLALSAVMSAPGRAQVSGTGLIFRKS